MATRSGSAAVSMIASLLAIVCLAATLFYLTQDTSLLASANGKHPLHALLFLALTLVFIGIAMVARPRRSHYG